MLLIALFFAAATCVLVGVGVALGHPGSALEAIWRLYPARRAMLMPHRVWLAPAFLALAAAMASASVGCFRRRKWGWWLAISIFALNGIGDAAQLALGHLLEGGVGVAIAAAIVSYLLRPDVRRAFA